jgi:hypothetical protein
LAALPGGSDPAPPPLDNVVTEQVDGSLDAVAAPKVTALVASLEADRNALAEFV